MKCTTHQQTLENTIHPFGIAQYGVITESMLIFVHLQEYHQSILQSYNKIDPGKLFVRIIPYTLEIYMLLATKVHG